MEETEEKRKLWFVRLFQVLSEERTDLLNFLANLISTNYELMDNWIPFEISMSDNNTLTLFYSLEHNAFTDVTLEDSTQQLSRHNLLRWNEQLCILKLMN